jgi:signal recognition particle subunit SEC65
MNRRLFIAAVSAVIGSATAPFRARAYPRSGLKLIGRYKWFVSYEMQTDIMWAIAVRSPKLEELEKKAKAARIKFIEPNSKIGQRLWREYSEEIINFVAAPVPAIAPKVQLLVRDFDENDRLLFGYDRIVDA